MYLHVNHPHIIHEIIQGEAILVNLETGNYYSSDSVGAVIWDGIESGMTAEQIADAVAQAYAGDANEMRASVSAFLQELADERLVLAAATLPEKTGAPFKSLPTDKPPFGAPALKKYTEMGDLLLLDPIHDVDTAGWPHTSLNGTGQP